MAKIESIRFNGRTTSEVRKQYRQWYEDNRAKISFVDEHEIKGCAWKRVGPTSAIRPRRRQYNAGRIRTSDDAGDEGGSSASAPKAASAGRVPLERGYGRRDSVLAALYRASGFDCRRRHALQHVADLH